MATDQATADYEDEQGAHEELQDSWAEWAESEMPQPISQPISKVCAQCVNWQPARRLHLANGTTQLSPGFCTVRAAADLSQLPQTYAERCRFYEEDIPF
jgi:hypothetical protein